MIRRGAVGLVAEELDIMSVIMDEVNIRLVMRNGNERSYTHAQLVNQRIFATKAHTAKKFTIKIQNVSLKALKTLCTVIWTFNV